jgi:hypothetical protein
MSAGPKKEVELTNQKAKADDLFSEPLEADAVETKIRRGVPKTAADNEAQANNSKDGFEEKYED